MMKNFRVARGVAWQILLAVSIAVAPPLAVAATDPTNTTLAAADAPASKDALFGNDLAIAPKSPWRGYVRGEIARTYASPSHWSKMLVSSEVDAEGSISANVKYHLGARFDYDFVYDANDFYPPE
ncbi:MAG TPA: hypothetical protein VFU90_11765, partial [Candidatus Tumulicola sp.]|nr:hypothetical protein [Candidatus Tumulicola sp.]